MKLVLKLLIPLLFVLTSCTPEQVRVWAQLDTDTQKALTEHVITSAANEFDVDPALMLKIAKCESGMNPAVKNAHSTATGLYQFLDTTWDRNLYRFDYTPSDVFNPVAQARTAAQMVAEGGLHNWNASRPCWGR